MKNKFIVCWIIAIFSLFSAACDKNEEPEPELTTSSTVAFFSPSLQKEVEVSVIVPESYKKGDRYPVVYMLHGHGGDNRDWKKFCPEIQQLADQYSFILVCPNGENSWYIDSPVIPESKYESYIVNDLVPRIDSRYPAVRERRGRMLSGISMGGYGSLYIAIHHKNLFCAAAAVAAVVDLRYDPASWNLTELLGDPAGEPERWASYSIINQSEALKDGGKNPALLLDCGESDFAYGINVELHDYWQSQGIEHTFRTRPGYHSYEYWRESFPAILEYLNNIYRDEHK